MTATQSTRLCWNCEGSIPADVDSCPYCGVEVGGDGARPQSFMPGSEGPAVKSAPLWTEARDGTEASKPWLAVFFLLPGAVFLLFSMALLFFSDHGVLVLRWQASLWPCFLLPGCGLLYLGAQALRSTE
jgi:hypothetical protein